MADHPMQINTSPYVYAGINPITRIDPDGNCWPCLIVEALALTLEGAAASEVIAAGGAITGTLIVMNGVNQYNRNTNVSVQDNTSLPKVRPQVVLNSDDSKVQPSKENGTPPNPYEAKGKPDHQGKVAELEKKAQGEATDGEQVLTEKKIQGQNARRRPDVQIVNKEGKTRKLFEAERKPNSQRNKKRVRETWRRTRNP